MESDATTVPRATSFDSKLKMEDYRISYPKHDCELRKKSKKFKRKTAFDTFKNQFLISDKNFLGNWYLRSKGSVAVEIFRHKTSGYWYVVHPFSLYRLWWELFMVTVFFFALVFIPFRGSFLNSFKAEYNSYFNQSQEPIIIGLEIEFALNTIFILDSAGFFFTGYYLPETARTELRPQKLFKHHIGRFILDVLTYTSADALILIFAGIDVYASLSDNVSVMLQILNLVQFVRFRTYFMFCYSCRKFKIFGLIQTRVLIVFVFYFLTLHWAVYFMLVVPEIMNGESLYKNTKGESLSWVQTSDFFKKTISNQYSLAMLRALRFIHFESDYDWETMYSAGDYVCGLIINVWSTMYWCFLIIYITEVIVADNALTTKVNCMLQQLKEYMKWKDLPGGLKKHLRQFYLHRFQAHYFSNKTILSKLTESLRKEIGLYTSHRLFQAANPFSTVPKNVVAGFVQKMHREMYFPNDVIIQGNTFGECMYFICSGTVSVATVGGKEISRLKDGDYFGEIALIAQNRRRTATVTAVTITEVYRLESSDFKAFVDEYPNVYEKLEKTAIERYNIVLVMEKSED